MQITLYLFPAFMNLPNPSPFCMKLETHLRMLGVDYEVRRVKGARGSPTGKVPYARIDAAVVSDSSLIIDAVEQKCAKFADVSLTRLQRAESLAWQRLLEEHLYWVIVYARWIDPLGRNPWLDMAARHFGVSRGLLGAFAPLLRRRIRGHLAGAGVGRHPPAAIWSMADRDVAAVAEWLGDREWCFGDAPHALDACLSAFTASAVCMPWDYPLKASFLRHANLLRHLDRVMARFYPEYDSYQAIGVQ